MKQSKYEKGLAGHLSPLDNLVANDSPPKVEAALRKLVSLLDGADPIRRAMVRQVSIKKLESIKVGSPARLVDAAFQMGKDETFDQNQGRPVLFDDPEVWLERVDGSALLDEIAATLKRFLVLPLHAAEAVALWVVHACALAAFEISPLLVVTSPIKRSGKTLLLDIISYIIIKRIFASNITPATLFRAVDKYTPGLLIDEADSFLRGNDELRGILNASHRKASAYVLRTVGDEHEPVFFVTWCAKAIALIGKLPATLEDRAILIPMKRRGPGEKVERFRSEEMKAELTTIKRKIMRWTADNLEALRRSEPEDPCELNDRAADNWRPLLAIAEVAGGAWPGKSRWAARALSGDIDEGSNSAAIQILIDLKALFSERDTDRLSSAVICEALGDMEDRPWPEWKRGEPITPSQLARLLGGFGVSPKNIRTGEVITKGYTLEDLIDPFSRYIPDLSATPLQPTPGVDLSGISDPLQSENVADKTGGKCVENKGCSVVADRNPPFANLLRGGRDKDPKSLIKRETEKDGEEQ